MGVCYPSPPNPGQFRLCVDTRSPHFRVELSRAKMSPPQEDGVLPARFSSACLSLPTQWEFPGSWDPERKQRSQRPADWEGREDWLIGRLGGRRVKGVAGSGRDMLEPQGGRRLQRSPSGALSSEPAAAGSMNSGHPASQGLCGAARRFQQQERGSSPSQGILLAKLVGAGGRHPLDPPGEDRQGRC